jgi:asparagine synthase (glutamine-hydrolysing)
MKCLPDLAMHQDEPIADPACLPMYFVSKAARQDGVRVVLVGEGSDEVFGGYPDFVHMLAVQAGRWRQLNALPRPLRRAIYQGARWIHRKDGMVDVLRRAAYDEPLYWGLTIAFWETEKRRLMNTPACSSNGSSAVGLVKGYYAEILKVRPDADFLQQISYVELSNRLPELLLMRVDKFSMAHSLEARAPFLDYKLATYALSLPSRLKIAGSRTKHILKEAVAGILPADVIDRPKQGFRVPLPAWMAGEMLPWAEERLFDSPLRQLGLFNFDYIRWMWDRHRSGVWDHSSDLWCLINLSAWYEHWFC